MRRRAQDRARDGGIPKGIAVPRLRHPPLAVLLGALIAALACVPRAFAQDADYLLRPQVDGDPRNPPRFNRTDGQGQTGVSRFGKSPDFNVPPASGAGLTGFDSRNGSRQKGKQGQKAAPKAVAQTATGRGLSSQASANAPVVADPRSPVGDKQRGTVRFTQNQGQNPNQALIQNPNQALSQNQTQQPRATPPNTNANAAYAAPPLADIVPVPMRRRTLPEEDGFAPTGIQAGAFILRPALELTTAYDTNAAREVTARPSWYAVVAPELLINSNWTRHELTANLRGSYSEYANASDLNRPSVDAKVNGRIDVTPWTRIDLESRFLLGTDNPGSPNIQAGIAKLPIFTTIGGSAGIGQRFNRFEVSVKGNVDRTVYQESLLTDGSTSSNDDRNFNKFGVDGRASYELLPGVKPFVEAGTDRREHDLALDRNGQDRDSSGFYARGGTTFELSRILTGDAAVGWIARSYKDPTLPDISGVTFDSSLTWVASALTSVKLTAKTTVDESVLAGVSGVFTREVAIQVDHAFRRWLLATLKYTVDFDDYAGLGRDDQRHAISALMTYKLTRELWLKGEYRLEWRHSNQPGNDTLANVFLLGVRLQR